MTENLPGVSIDLNFAAAAIVTIKYVKNGNVAITNHGLLKAVTFIKTVCWITSYPRMLLNNQNRLALVTLFSTQSNQGHCYPLNRLRVRHFFQQKVLYPLTHREGDILNLVRICWHIFVCAISCEQMVRYLPNFHGYIIGTSRASINFQTQEVPDFLPLKFGSLGKSRKSHFFSVLRRSALSLVEHRFLFQCHTESSWYTLLLDVF